MTTLVTDEISPAHRAVEPAKATPGQQRIRRVFVSASVGIFQRLIQLGSTIVVMPILLRALGTEKFGVWGAVASLAWLSSLADIGTGNALVTLVARSGALDHAEQTRRHVGGAVSIGSALGTLMLFVALVALINGGAQGSAGAYLIAVIGLALNLPLSAANNVWMALQKGYVSGTWELVQTVLTTTGLIAASALTTDVRVYVAIVYGCLVLANIGSLIHLFFRHPELWPRGLWMSASAMRDVASQGWLFFALAVTGGLAFMLDNVLALGLLGPSASASMTIALRICITAAGAMAVMSQPLWPAFAEAAHKGDRAWILKALFGGSALLVGLAALGSSLLMIYGQGLLHRWLHTDLGIGRGLLWAVAAWVVAQALVRIPILLLNGLLILRYQIAVVSLATVLGFALKFSLAPHFGVAGILWSTTASAALVLMPACLWRIWEWAASPLPRVRELP